MVGRLRVEHIHLATCYRLSFMSLHEEIISSCYKNQPQDEMLWSLFMGEDAGKYRKRKRQMREVWKKAVVFTLWYVAISIQYCKLPAGNFHLNSIKQHTTIKVSWGFLQVHDSVFKFHELVCLSTSAWARSLTSSQCSPSSENNAVWRGITVHECEGRTWPYGRWSQVLWSHELALTTPSKILVADCLYSCWYMPISQQLLFLMLCTEGIPLSGISWVTRKTTYC